jgi:hypothetical protein
LRQNLAVEVTASPQFGQTNSSGCPQFSQKREPAGLSKLHVGQFT